ncbi:hypothetical protein ABPG74_019538 [Tetrahymena malaccensis]
MNYNEKNSHFILQQRLDIQESQYLEYKNYQWPFYKIEDMKITMLKIICSFLNTSGGTILIGVNDKQIVKGVRIEDIDVVKSYLEGLSDYFNLNLEGLIKTVFVPLKKCVSTKFNTFTWMIKTYIIRIEVKQGLLNKLYSFQYKNQLYCAYRGDGKNIVYDRLIEIIKKSYEKSLKPINKAEEIQYEEPDSEHLSQKQINEFNELQKQEVSQIVFSNIDKNKQTEFTNHLQQKLDEKYQKCYKLKILKDFLIVLETSYINSISQQLINIFTNCQEFNQFTFKNNNVSYGLLSHEITLKFQSLSEIFRITNLIQEYDFGYEVNYNNKNIVVNTFNDMKSAPQFYSDCKKNNYKPYLTLLI